METKNADELVIKTLDWMQYSSHFLVSPHSPGGGGLALYWKQDVELEVLSSCQNYLDTRIKAAGKQFFATFVYGEPDRSKRKVIWDLLTVQGSNREDPWFLTGDFNDIIDASEKQGGPIRHEGTFVDLEASWQSVISMIYAIQETSSLGGGRDMIMLFIVDWIVLCQMVHGLNHTQLVDASTSALKDLITDHFSLTLIYQKKERRKSLDMIDGLKTVKKLVT